MKIYRNDALITRNGRVGFISALAGPVLIAVGASFILTGAGIGIALIFLSIGFLVYQIGQAFQRFGRGADKDFNENLKKLPDTYSIHHFTSPVSHLLVGPAGVWILVPRYGKGKVTYNSNRNRWEFKPKTFISGLLGGGLARPELEIVSEADALDRHLRKHWDHEEHPHVNAALVLMDMETTIDAEESVVPTLHISKVHGFLKKQEQEKSVELENVSRIKALFLTE